MAELTVRVTEYTVSLLPEEDPNASAQQVKVAYRGRDLWAVLYRSWCLGRDGEWDWEPLPSSREDDWLAEHRFPEAEALERAKVAAGLLGQEGVDRG